ncbi:MAG: 4'-phosphopantetheinyl transferase family protein [Oscillospiraceae bacterium]
MVPRRAGAAPHSHSGGRWSARSRTRRSGSTCRRTGPAGRWRSRERFFAPEEAEWLRSRGEAAFFDLWCAKESWLKYTGRGLSALPEAIVLAPDGQLPARPDARLQLLPVFDGYSLCVCTKDAARVALRELWVTPHNCLRASAIFSVNPAV